MTMKNEQHDCTIKDLIGRVDRLIHELIAIRAEKWMNEWPEGHADRPKRMPPYVKQYIKDQEEKKAKKS